MTFKARTLLPYFYLALPFFGFCVFAIGARGVRIDWAIAFVFILLLTIQNISQEKSRIEIDNVLLSLILLIFFVFLSIVNPLLSGHPESVTDFITTYLQFLLGTLLFFWAYQLRLTDNEIKFLLKVILVIQFIIAAFAILQLIMSYFGYTLRLPFTNPGRPLQHSGYENVTGSVLRSMGTFSEPRQLGAYLLTGVCISSSVLYDNVKLFRNNFLPLFFFVIIVIGIFAILI